MYIEFTLNIYHKIKEVDVMKRIWNLVNNMNMDKRIKNKIYIALMICVSAAFGAGLWLVIGRLLFQRLEWLVCFIGYPAVIFGFYGAILYIYNHDFK